MLKKAINPNNVHGHLTHRDAIWVAIRKLKKFDCKNLWSFVNSSKQRPKGVHRDAKETSLSSIQSYVSGLTTAGYLKLEVSDNVSGNKRTNKRLWTLIKDVGIDAPRVTCKGKRIITGKTFENMWKAMKILKTFNWMEIKAHASTRESPIGDSEVQEYIRNLYNAEYLIRTGKEKGLPARYKLIASKYTGPKPPMRQRVTQIYDANLGKVVWPKEKTNECS